jgi:hypothetical protein
MNGAEANPVRQVFAVAWYLNWSCQFQRYAVPLSSDRRWRKLGSGVSASVTAANADKILAPSRGVHHNGGLTSSTKMADQQEAPSACPPGVTDTNEHIRAQQRIESECPLVA